jgi:hypothetical protein
LEFVVQLAIDPVATKQRAQAGGKAISRPPHHASPSVLA